MLKIFTGKQLSCQMSQVKWIPSTALAAHVHRAGIAVHARAELGALAHLAAPRLGQRERVHVIVQLLQKHCEEGTWCS
jgi:hypothetical protein